MECKPYIIGLPFDPAEFDRAHFCRHIGMPCYLNGENIGPKCALNHDCRAYPDQFMRWKQTTTVKRVTHGTMTMTGV